jgi:hypothetical protein
MRASDDDMAIGVLEAINQANRQDEMWILGGAGMKEMIARVRDGDPLIPADVTYPPSMAADGYRTDGAQVCLQCARIRRFRDRLGLNHPGQRIGLLLPE